MRFHPLPVMASALGSVLEPARRRPVWSPGSAHGTSRTRRQSDPIRLPAGDDFDVGWRTPAHRPLACLARRRQGHGLPVSRLVGDHREVFPRRHAPAAARLRGGDHGVARPGRIVTPCRRPRQGPRPLLSPLPAGYRGLSPPRVVLPDCPPPYFALGHSMGGGILPRRRPFFSLPPSTGWC